MRLICLLSVTFTLLVGMMAACGAEAAQSKPFISERDTVVLVSDSDTATADRPLRIGLYFRLKPGWHTYWKNPGDAGEPVALSVTVSGSVTGKRDSIEWPAPTRLPEGPLMSYGYTGDVLLPVTIQSVAGAGDTVKVSAHADWLVCAAVCVPEEADFELTLPAGPLVPSAQASLFTEAATQVPQPSPFKATITQNGSLTVEGEGFSSKTVQQAWFIPDEPGQIDQVAPQSLKVSSGRLMLQLKPLAGFPKGKPFGGLLDMRDVAGTRSVLAVTAQPVNAVMQMPTGDGMSWLMLAGLAFLGGLILNLMPCVFPVLAMKALAILRLHENRSHLRSGVAYTAGILLTFACLGGVMLAARGAGISAGWGFQFQSPAFVTGICLLLFAVSLGLLGIFELPVISAGQSLLYSQRGLLGDFLTGMLAVLVATPCTAPFMGGAIAGALVAPPVAALGIFLAMGLGLASPYLMLALIPGLGRFLPRPGRWMEILRQVLAFPVLATCVWLLWVLAQQNGNAVAVAGGGLLALGFSGWLVVTARGIGGRRGQIGLFAAAILVACAPLPFLFFLSSGSGFHKEMVAETSSEQTFSENRLNKLRGQGKPVFVDMTAAWCITCLVNEHVTLESSSVQKEFTEKGIVFLKGDWTNRNPEITTFLHRYGRDGVPLYVYFPPHGEGYVLPQVLTGAIVKAALESH
ncbi:protein-disulfide reductase DsbD family protein [Acetobacter sp.]|uniref:protein-disulfide reductase DsbD family protein n=1 Tax=Acetobacter sp. TaxID=440 RepID=UPI0039EAA83A